MNSLFTEELNLERAENDLVKKQAELEVQIKDLEIQLGQNKLELDKARLKTEIDKTLLSLRDWQDYQFAFQKAKKEYEKTGRNRCTLRSLFRSEHTIHNSVSSSNR